MNRYTQGLLKMLPNILTLLRVVLACILNLYILIYFGRQTIPALVFILIFLADFLDGRIARRYGYTSKTGAVLDIMADFFYIVFSYAVLCSLRIIPIWFFIIVLLKFMEFLFTSYLLRHRGRGDSIFVFDFIGRYIAALFYCIPLLAYMLFLALPSLHNIVINILCGCISIIAFMSSLYRFWNCYEGNMASASVRASGMPADLSGFQSRLRVILPYQLNNISRGQRKINSR